jgi:Tol biopolymer transport system component
MSTKKYQRHWKWIIPTAALFMGALGAMGMSRAPKPSGESFVFTQEPFGARPGKSQGRIEGCRIVSLAPNGKLRVLTPKFISACDPCVSFDGRRILFSGKRTPEGRWNIYEMDTDGSNKTQVTKDLGDCAEPIYLAIASVTAPTFDDKVRWICFTSTAPEALNERGDGPLTSLYVINLSPIKSKGTVIWRTTYGLGGDIFPTVLRDGRVLFSSEQRDRFGLMTVTWAGDNLNPFYVSHASPKMKTMACEMPDRRALVFVESDEGTPDSGGRLAQVSFRRPLHSHEVLSKEGNYRTPHLLPDGGLVVSHTSGSESYGVFVFDFDQGGPGRRIYDDPDWNDVDAMAIHPHPEPLARIPMLEFASVLDIGGFKGAGQLHCMSVYDSDRPEVRQIEPGRVKWARFVEGVPVRASEQEQSEKVGKWESGKVGDTPSEFQISDPAIRNPKSAIRNPRRGAAGGEWPPPFVRTRILGEVPVESDGSFFVNVIGNTPFFIQILDEQKKVLHTMRAWTWVRSGSQRGCIGCHEDKELAPENRATQALLRMQPSFLPEKQRLGVGWDSR